MEEIKKKIASMLLEIGAIKIQPQNPFTWASGWKSPIYCDNRLSLSHPEVRTYIKKSLAQKIKIVFPEVSAIAGVATAGIPQGALVADELNLPMLYVRSKPKGHGRENMIEGEVSKDAKIVVIEDLISTGGSSIKATEALQEAGHQIEGLFAIFTYGFPLADQNFEKAGIPFQTLTDYPTLLEIALNERKIKESDVTSLKEWSKNPSEWGM